MDVSKSQIRQAFYSLHGDRDSDLFNQFWNVESNNLEQYKALVAGKGAYLDDMQLLHQYFNLLRYSASTKGEALANYVPASGPDMMTGMMDADDMLSSTVLSEDVARELFGKYQDRPETMDFEEAVNKFKRNFVEKQDLMPTSREELDITGAFDVKNLVALKNFFRSYKLTQEQQVELMRDIMANIFTTKNAKSMGKILGELDVDNAKGFAETLTNLAQQLEPWEIELLADTYLSREDMMNLFKTRMPELISKRGTLTANEEKVFETLKEKFQEEWFPVYGVGQFPSMRSLQMGGAQEGGKMGFIEWFSKAYPTNTKLIGGIPALEKIARKRIKEHEKKLKKELVKCASGIAKAVSKTQFMTYLQGEEVRFGEDNVAQMDQYEQESFATDLFTALKNLLLKRGSTDLGIENKWSLRFLAKIAASDQDYDLVKTWFEKGGKKKDWPKQVSFSEMTAAENIAGNQEKGIKGADLEKMLELLITASSKSLAGKDEKQSRAKKMIQRTFNAVANRYAEKFVKRVIKAQEKAVAKCVAGKENLYQVKSINDPRLWMDKDDLEDYTGSGMGGLGMGGFFGPSFAPFQQAFGNQALAGIYNVGMARPVPAYGARMTMPMAGPGLGGYEENLGFVPESMWPYNGGAQVGGGKDLDFEEGDDGSLNGMIQATLRAMGKNVDMGGVGKVDPNAPCFTYNRNPNACAKRGDCLYDSDENECVNVGSISVGLKSQAGGEYSETSEDFF
jgi:hypothetical protein